jgi:sugar (pentulose or hexulose) kinase
LQAFPTNPKEFLGVSVNGLLGGVDVGTTSVKALLMTVDGVEVAEGRAPTRWERTADGVEADPFALRAAAMLALADALASAPDGRVISLGIASMGEAGVLVAADEQPLAPVVAWHDTRDLRQLSDLAQSLGGQRFSLRTGLPLWPQWSVTKHRWFHDNVPSTRFAVRRYNVAEWVARHLGADPVCELSLASRTGWLDLAAKTPWDEALEWSGARTSLLGDLVQAGTPVGRVGPDCSLQQLQGATLTIAGHDHQAAAIGAGAFDDHDELDSCGTADAIVRTTLPTLTTESLSALTAAGVTVGWHALEDRWSVLGATQGGLILQGIMARLGVEPRGLGELDRLAAQSEPGATTVALGPESHDVSISGSDAPGDVWRAATEAVTGQLRELSEVIAAGTGPRGDLVVTGGWSNSSALMTAKASALGALWRTTTLEAGARGAALLGGLAHGTYSSPHDLPRPPRTRLHAAVTDGHSTRPDRLEESTE